MLRNPDSRYLRYVGEYRLPFPAAVYARLHFTVQSPTDQVGSLLASTQWIVATLSGLASGVLASYDRDDLSSTARAMASSRLTFGQAVDRLHRMAGAGRKWSAKGQISSLGELPAWWDSIEDSVPTMKRIVEQRNELVHGGPLMAERTAECLPDLRSNYLELLDVSAFLGTFETVATRESRRVPRSAMTDVDVRLVAGCNPLFEARRLRIAEELEPETVYLIERGTAVAYPLYPDVIVLEGQTRASIGTSFGMLEGVSGSTGNWIPLDLRSGLEMFANEDAGASGSRVSGDLGEKILPPIRVRAALEQLLSDSSPTRAGFLEEDCLPGGYELVGLLRRSGGAYVALATQAEEGLLCAVKSLTPQAASDLPAATRIEREIAILKRLSGSPHVVRLVDHGQVATGAPFVATEYLAFGTLEERIRQQGPTGWTETLYCIEGVVRGLIEIHGRGVVHRDISTSNLLLRSVEPLEAAFADFGAAVGENDPRVTATMDQVGTPDFMAPELLGGRGVATVASDLYSVGAVAVAMLTGTTRRPSESDLDDLDIPEAGIEMLHALLSPVPESRPPTAAALLSRILRGKNGDAGVRRPVPAAPRHDLGWWTSAQGDQFRRLPTGRFLMGGTIFPNETPVHEVHIPEPLLVANTPITNALFGQFMKATRYRSASKSFLLHQASGGRGGALPNSWRHPEAPVVFVSWRDATEYCLWRSEFEGLDYRLLSEAEWEYTCRAGTRTRYYWGNAFDPGRANCGQRRDGPTPVGSYAPNPWGIFDMLGNVWEWTRDRLDVVTKERSLFYSAPQQRESEGPVNDGPNSLTSERVEPDFRVGRGGSWFSNDRNMRPANRRGEYEGSAMRAFGFRICARGVLEAKIEFDEQ